MEIVAYLVNALLYGALAIYFWRTHWAPAGPQPAPQGASAGMPAAAEHFAVLVPLALHAALLGRSLFAGEGLHLGVANAISAILWLTVLIYWLANFFYRLDGMHALVLPLAAAAALLPGLMPPAAELPNTNLAAFKFHLLIAMLAYSLFTIASLHVALMALLEKRLHDGSLSRVLQKLPPLLTMEALLFRIIWAGFILLTLTLASGVVFSEELFGKPAQFNHKTIFGVVSWLIFAALLAGRHVYGWRGRVAVRWTLAGFGTLVLAYLGSKFVLEVILSR
ncbi:MAG TPA: cytochrome c biogenesis protein CcsA [Burkholderiales bacterium]|nr:cytochrome c biogenesis protein CcsA [Burkholderiales bacterium]